METLVLRLAPGEDLRAVVPYAGAEEGTVLEGPLELVTLSGTLSVDGPHLHASVSDARGEVRAGHVMPGCEVRTTAEVVIGLLPEWEFRRAVDPRTGYSELAVRRVA